MNRTVGLYLLLSMGAFAQQETVSYSYNGFPLPIFADSADVITSASIFVPQALSVTSVTVRLQIDYPNSGDLKVYLYSPSGIRTRLLDHDCSVKNIDTTFDDSADAKWDEFCPTEPGRGPFRADEPLWNFVQDRSSLGTWRLAVENDTSDSRQGFVNVFSLTIRGVRQISPTFTPETVVNAASRMGNAIAPGEMISVYGAALGPNDAISAPMGALPTELGGVTVTMDGTAVPIAYASRQRVDIQAPFGIQSGHNVAVQVKSSNMTSSVVSVPVIDASPGIFTHAGNGTGQIVARNSDGKVNLVLQPADKGSIVTIYASGLGIVSPTIPAGAVPPAEAPATVQGVGATVNGVSVPVVGSRLAAGMPGSYEVKIQLPQELKPGPQAVGVSAAGASSAQTEAVIYVK